MGWFKRQARGRDARQVQREHARYVRAAGVDRALDLLSGSYGLRRFLLYFERRGGGVVVTDIDSQALQWGGGPPPVDATGSRVQAVERSLTALHRNMGVSAPWNQGALGFVRDAAGKTRLFTWFDDDRGLAELARLPIPGPPGHPLESNEYRALLSRWEAGMSAVHKATQARSHDWTQWRIGDEGWLTLSYGGAGNGPTDQRRHPAIVLATYLPRWHRFEWQVDEPLFDDEVFRHGSISTDMNGAMELALMATARLGAGWLFSGSIDTPPGTLFAAVKE